MDLNLRMTIAHGICHKDTKHTDIYNSKYYKNFT